jgi:hypothetical protein
MGRVITSLESDPTRRCDAGAPNRGNADIKPIFHPPLVNDAFGDPAAATCHLTARQAGELAGRAGVKRLVPFHFSARYQGDAACLEREAVEVFAANQPNTTAGPDITSA